MLKSKILIGLMVICLVITGSAFPGWHERSKFENRKEKMEKFRIWKLTEYLDLTPKQSEKFFPEYNQFEKRKRDRHEQIKELIIHIDSLSQEESFAPDEEDYQKYSQKLMELEKAEVELKKEFLKDLDDVLNTKQKVKFLIFDDKFKHELMEKLRDKHFNPDKEEYEPKKGEKR